MAVGHELCNLIAYELYTHEDQLILHDIQSHGYVHREREREGGATFLNRNYFLLMLFASAPAIIVREIIR